MALTLPAGRRTLPPKTLENLRKVSTVALATTAALLAVAPTAGNAAAAGPCPNGYVALTYDDGPTAATLPALLDGLRAAGARATFFNQGNNAEARPDLVLAQRRAGMWIGNHTVTHPHLPEIVAAARTLRPGGIILMHDRAQPSVDAVPRIVGELRERGVCPGRIAFTPRDVPFGDTVFHAVAVAP